MKKTKRATIFFDNMDSYKVLVFESWLKKWKDKITILSEKFGCGCHHDLYEVEGPEEAFTELPSSVFAKKTPS
jgi:hypothetical protein